MGYLEKAIRVSKIETEPDDKPRLDSFLEFVEWLGVKLTMGQAEFSRVAFDFIEPVSGDTAETLFGCMPVGRYRVVAAVCGARSGKSYILVALRLLFGMLVRDLSSLAPGQHAVALIVAPNGKLRREVLNYALGAVNSKPALTAMLVDAGAEGFGLRRPDGHLVRFEAGVATVGGYGGVGRTLTDFALDECAHFRDASAKVNDEDIFDAGAKRVLPDGQIIVASTPWAERGLLYKLWRDNFGHPKDALVAQAPTMLMNPSETVMRMIEMERRRDPDKAKREYDAIFMSSGTSLFFEPATIEGAITDEEFHPRPGDAFAAGGDFAFRSDSSALVLVAKRGETLHVFDGIECRSGDIALKPSTTVAQFASKIKGFCTQLMADGHYREAIAEHLDAHELTYIPAPSQPAESHVRARMLLREGRVKIHRTEFRDRLIQQMREVTAKPTSGGGLSVIYERWATGGHGDLCAAFVLALWQVWGDVMPEPLLEVTSPEMAAKRDRARAWEEVQRPDGKWWNNKSRESKAWRKK